MPEFKSEFDRLFKQWERSQKESMSRLNKKDPLAEFEKLFKKWKAVKNNIKKLTRWHEKDREF